MLPRSLAWRAYESDNLAGSIPATPLSPPSCRCLSIILTSYSWRLILTLAVSNIHRLLDGGAGRDKAKCELLLSVVGSSSLRVREKDNEATAMGFKVILPGLTDLERQNGGWDQLKSKLRG